MIILFVFIAILVIAVYATNSRKKRIAALKRHYEQLLRQADKRAALDAGRIYYSTLRKGKLLTIYDEQAITNDLSTMR